MAAIIEKAEPVATEFVTRKFKAGEWTEFQRLVREHKLVYDCSCGPNTLTFRFGNAVDAVLFRMALGDLLTRAEL